MSYIPKFAENLYSLCIPGPGVQFSVCVLEKKRKTNGNIKNFKLINW